MSNIDKTAKTGVPIAGTSIHIRWIRFPHDPSANLKEALKKATAYATYGGKGEGKSALAENIANKYRTVIDLFGSRDNESLAWLRSERKDSVLLLKGTSTEVACDWDVINANQLKLQDLEDYRVITTCSAFYSKLDEEWYSLAQIMEKLWTRDHWTEPICLLIREASSLIYSRTKLGETQTQAKNYMMYVLREMRHCGFALALDSLRWFGIDIDTRTLSDYTFLKAQGIEGLPRNLHFLYRYFDAYGIMRMGVETFAVITRKGAIGCGWSECPSWHKLEKEDMLQLLNIQVKHAEVPITSSGEKYARLSDFEHVGIVTLRNTLDEGRVQSMEKISKKTGRSTRTVNIQINYHNNAISQAGECDRCRRAKCNLMKISLQ